MNYLLTATEKIDKSYLEPKKSRTFQSNGITVQKLFGKKSYLIMVKLEKVDTIK